MTKNVYQELIKNITDDQLEAAVKFINYRGHSQQVEDFDEQIQHDLSLAKIRYDMEIWMLHYLHKGKIIALSEDLYNTEEK